MFSVAALLVLCVAAVEINLERELDYAFEVLTRGDLEQGSAILKPLLGMYRENVGVLSLAAVLCWQQGEYEKAFMYYDIALSTQPGNIPLRVAMAQLLVKMKRFSTAKTHLEFVLDFPNLRHEDQFTVARELQLLAAEMIQHGILQLHSDDSLQGVSVLVGAAVSFPEQYGRERSRIMAAIHQIAEQLRESCRSLEGTNLLTTWIRTSHTINIGISKHLWVLLAINQQILGMHEESRASAKRAIQLCKEDSLSVRFDEWMICEQAYRLNKEYRRAFELIRAAHDDSRMQSADHVNHSDMRPEKLELSEMKLEHDSDQLSYLFDQGFLNKSVAPEQIDRILSAFAYVKEHIRAEVSTDMSGGPDEVPKTIEMSRLPSHLQAEFRIIYNKVYWLHPGNSEDWTNRAVLNPSLDFDGFSQAFNAGEVLVIDNFLTPEALQVMRDIGIQSQFWHETKRAGYVGAMSENGFAPAPLARLAIELESAMPQVFKNHTLLMHWGFKYPSGSDKDPVIKAHADTAAINLNFWVIDDDANLDNESGGLLVYNKRLTGSNVDLKEYNSQTVSAASIGLTEKDIKRTVPYRQNRAVLFHSSYLHETDRHHFKAGYANRRINFTLLFGFMESVRCISCLATEGVLCTSPLVSSR